MALSRTLTIIKPDAFGSGKTGRIIAHLEDAGFRVIASRVLHLTDAEAGAFYEVHRDRPFFGSLTRFMTSGPCMPIVLEREDAVAAGGAEHEGARRRVAEEAARGAPQDGASLADRPDLRGAALLSKHGLAL